MIDAYSFLFWIVGPLTLFSALGVILFANPIYCAMSLVLSMVGIGGLFVLLQAHFLAGVQVAVYAGAVMVLFLLVLMIFDLKRENKPFTRGLWNGFLKIASVSMLSGFVVGSIYMSTSLIFSNPHSKTFTDVTKTISSMLFAKYLFAFEALGVLLLIVAVGAVALSRSKGGTHDRR